MFISVRFLALLLILPLAACSSPSGGPEVATVVSAAPSPSPSAVTGVQLRLDMSMAERKKIQESYLECLAQHGIPNIRQVLANGPTEQDKAALAACEGKKPIEPPELDPKLNPDYEEQSHKYQQCMDKAGINAETAEATFDKVSKACEETAYRK